MHADFSRVTFRPERHYSAVVAQQGRVQLDAEANEHTAIHAYLTRTLTTDLVGAHAGPASAAGFKVGYQVRDGDPPDLTIGGGRYYVDGILCDATKPEPLVPVPAGSASPTEEPSNQAQPAWTYWAQPHAYLDPGKDGDPLPAQFPILIYLRVWERLLTATEEPDILETALGAALPDTTARLKVIWQVLPIHANDGFTPPPEPTPDNLRTAFDEWAVGRGKPASRLAVRTEQPPKTDDDPCIVHPDSRYRGAENQLYRIEVHAGATADSATFKWSRDNGSVVYPVSIVEGDWVTLTSLGRDDKLDLHVGHWIEGLDDAQVERPEPHPLLQVVDVDVPARAVRLSAEPPPTVGRLPARHPYLRRWDHQAAAGRAAPKIVDGALQIKEGHWLPLEDGVEVWFTPGGTYRPGDYWVVAARTIKGDVEWPRDADGTPLLAPPAGPRYYYAPLGWIQDKDTVVDLRQMFRPLATSVE